jgi:hypothetical protein
MPSDNAATSARERGTGERRATWAGMATRPEGDGSTCRIAARRLTARGGDRVAERRPGPLAASTCRIAARRLCSFRIAARASFWALTGFLDCTLLLFCCGLGQQSYNL